MIVHAHATTLPDQKAVVRAGADVVVHMVQGEELDDEYLALLKEKKPYWATVIGLGDQTAVCDPDPFFEQALPTSVVATIRATMERRPLAPSCGPPSPNAATREEIMAYNFPRMIAAGARIVLGTDTGIHPGHTFGSGEHLELARWVQLGLTPSQAIVAATKHAGGADRADRHGHARAGQARRFHRARRQPAREHPQHAADRERVPRRQEIRPRRDARQVAACGHRAQCTRTVKTAGGWSSREASGAARTRCG